MLIFAFLAEISSSTLLNDQGKVFCYSSHQKCIDIIFSNMDSGTARIVSQLPLYSAKISHLQKNFDTNCSISYHIFPQKINRAKIKITNHLAGTKILLSERLLDLKMDTSERVINISNCAIVTLNTNIKFTGINNTTLYMKYFAISKDNYLESTKKLNIYLEKDFNINNSSNMTTIQLINEENIHVEFFDRYNGIDYQPFSLKNQENANKIPKSFENMNLYEFKNKLSYTGYGSIIIQEKDMGFTVIANGSQEIDFFSTTDVLFNIMGFTQTVIIGKSELKNVIMGINITNVSNLELHGDFSSYFFEYANNNYNSQVISYSNCIRFMKTVGLYNILRADNITSANIIINYFECGKLAPLVGYGIKLTIEYLDLTDFNDDHYFDIVISELDYPQIIINDISESLIDSDIYIVAKFGNNYPTEENIRYKIDEEYFFLQLPENVTNINITLFYIDSDVFGFRQGCSILDIIQKGNKYYIISNSTIKPPTQLCFSSDKSLCNSGKWTELSPNDALKQTYLSPSISLIFFNINFAKINFSLLNTDYCSIVSNQMITIEDEDQSDLDIFFIGFELANTEIISNRTINIANADFQNSPLEVEKLNIENLYSDLISISKKCEIGLKSEGKSIIYATSAIKNGSTRISCGFGCKIEIQGFNFFNSFGDSDFSGMILVNEEYKFQLNGNRLDIKLTDLPNYFNRFVFRANNFKFSSMSIYTQSLSEIRIENGFANSSSQINLNLYSNSPNLVLNLSNSQFNMKITADEAIKFYIDLNTSKIDSYSLMTFNKGLTIDSSNKCVFVIRNIALTSGIIDILSPVVELSFRFFSTNQDFPFRLAVSEKESASLNFRFYFGPIAAINLHSVVSDSKNVPIPGELSLVLINKGTTLTEQIRVNLTYDKPIHGFWSKKSILNLIVKNESAISLKYGEIKDLPLEICFEGPCENGLFVDSSSLDQDLYFPVNKMDFFLGTKKVSLNLKTLDNMELSVKGSNNSKASVNLLLENPNSVFSSLIFKNINLENQFNIISSSLIIENSILKDMNLSRYETMKIDLTSINELQYVNFSNLIILETNEISSITFYSDYLLINENIKILSQKIDFDLINKNLILKTGSNVISGIYTLHINIDCSITSVGSWDKVEKSKIIIEYSIYHIKVDLGASTFVPFRYNGFNPVTEVFNHKFTKFCICEDNCDCPSKSTKTNEQITSNEVFIQIYYQSNSTLSLNLEKCPNINLLHLIALNRSLSKINITSKYPDVFILDDVELYSTDFLHEIKSITARNAKIFSNIKSNRVILVNSTNVNIQRTSLNMFIASELFYTSLPISYIKFDSQNMFLRSEKGANNIQILSRSDTLYSISMSDYLKGQIYDQTKKDDDILFKINIYAFSTSKSFSQIELQHSYDLTDKKSKDVLVLCPISPINLQMTGPRAYLSMKCYAKLGIIPIRDIIFYGKIILYVSSNILISQKYSITFNYLEFKNSSSLNLASKSNLILNEVVFELTKACQIIYTIYYDAIPSITIRKMNDFNANYILFKINNFNEIIMRSEILLAKRWTLFAFPYIISHELSIYWLDSSKQIHGFWNGNSILELKKDGIGIYAISKVNETKYLPISICSGSESQCGPSSILMTDKYVRLIPTGITIIKYIIYSGRTDISGKIDTDLNANITIQGINNPVITLDQLEVPDSINFALDGVTLDRSYQFPKVKVNLHMFSASSTSDIIFNGTDVLSDLYSVMHASNVQTDKTTISVVNIPNNIKIDGINIFPTINNQRIIDAANYRLNFDSNPPVIELSVNSDKWELENNFQLNMNSYSTITFNGNWNINMSENFQFLLNFNYAFIRGVNFIPSIFSDDQLVVLSEKDGTKLYPGELVMNSYVLVESETLSGKWKIQGVDPSMNNADIQFNYLNIEPDSEISINGLHIGHKLTMKGNSILNSTDRDIILFNEGATIDLVSSKTNIPYIIVGRGRSLPSKINVILDFDGIHYQDVEENFYKKTNKLLKSSILSCNNFKSITSISQNSMKSFQFDLYCDDGDLILKGQKVKMTPGVIFSIVFSCVCFVCIVSIIIYFMVCKKKRESSSSSSEELLDTELPDKFSVSFK